MVPWDLEARVLTAVYERRVEARRDGRRVHPLEVERWRQEARDSVLERDWPQRLEQARSGHWTNTAIHPVLRQAIRFRRSKWRRRFVGYLNLTDNSNKDDGDKTDLLLYLMGEKAEDLLLQLNAEGSFNEILEALDSYFEPKINPLYARYEFNKRNQTSDETVEQYIRSLYVAADKRNFNSVVRDEMIRDRIVVGILSPKAREKMLLQCNLTLEDAKTMRC
ncbi:hypothetical protein ACJJTC_008599 [Scirpophaga incertulas]